MVLNKSGNEYMTKITFYTVQMAATPEVGIQDLRFLCFACYPMVLNISAKVHKNISDIFQVTEWTSV